MQYSKCSHSSQCPQSPQSHQQSSAHIHHSALNHHRVISTQVLTFVTVPQSSQPKEAKSSAV
eukprot:1161934-Pelagomonas_calceolata.AAC.1